MSYDQRNRAVAADAIDEVTAFLDASLSTGELSGDIRPLVLSVRKGLHTSAMTLRAGDDADTEPPVFPAESMPRSAGRADVGHSMAAAMLRLARAVSRRALREAEAVHEVNVAILDYLSAVPDLLGGLADALDDEEARSVPLGLCIGQPLPGA